MFEVYMASEAQIVITERDFEQLEALLNSLPKCNHSGACRLMGELQRADVVASDKLTPNIVTMNSRVTFTVLSTGETFTYTLVYPKDTDGCADKIAVLSLMGSALLALFFGKKIEWFLSTCKSDSVRIKTLE